MEIWSQFRAVLKQEMQAMVEQALEEELTEAPAARSQSVWEWQGHCRNKGHRQAESCD